MALAELAQDPQIRRITTHPEDDDAHWRRDLDRFIQGDRRLTRGSAGESAICAVQRLMIFLGYSTSSSGAFSVDGDFGRGTNRGVAQFQVEQGLSRRIGRSHLCYPCRWNTASRLITAVPEATLTPHSLARMVAVARERIARGQVMTGDFDSAIFHLNALHKRRFLNCREILLRYGEAVHAATRQFQDESGVLIHPEWVLAIIRQETAGIIRPRFEQHYLSRLAARHPDQPLPELRMRSMSLGLGQVMGENFSRVGAASATQLFTAPVSEQVMFVVRFLKARREELRKRNPGEADFRAVARYYNGPKYAAHHYHERLQRWFREFRELL